MIQSRLGRFVGVITVIVGLTACGGNGDSRNLFDRDNDGWLDGVDEFPDDPNRH